VNWSDENGVCTDENPWRFEVTEDRNLTANFVQISFNVVFTSTAGGTVSVGDTVIPCVPEGTSITAEAFTDSCYTFTGWMTTDNILISTDNPYTFNITADDTFVAHFEKITYEITVSANPPEGGAVSEGGDFPACDSALVTVEYIHPCYTFVNWTENGIEVSTNLSYLLDVDAPHHLVANFEYAYYDVILQPNPPNGGTLTGFGNYGCEDTVTITATPNEGYKFDKWTTVAGVWVSDSAEYEFIVMQDTTLVAHFTQTHFRVTILANDTVYGTTDPKDTEWYEAGAMVQAVAIEKSCYSFANWTDTTGKVLSSNMVFEFVVTQDTTLVANFFALDFDTYCATLWCNTFELDLRRLDSLGLEVADCRWYKNGIEEMETQTINQFSYSAGPYATHLLEEKPTWYMFEVITKKHGSYCSIRKIIDYCPNKSGAPPKNLVIFPNPTSGNNSFTVENVIDGEPVQIFNQFGICIKNNMAAGEVISMTLDVPSGVYMIRCGDRFGKIVVIR
jgi:hypothetical protein